MWLLDLVVLGVAVVWWVATPRWIRFTADFYRRRGLGFLADDGTLATRVFRSVSVLVGLIALVDLFRR